MEPTGVYFQDLFGKNPFRALGRCLKKTEAKVIAWASDIHFDHSKPEGIDRFFEEVKKQKPDVLLLAGDIELGCENPTLPFYGTIPAAGLIATLKKIREVVECQIYFVCGNHDFYFSSFDKVRREIKELCEQTAGIGYLHESKGIELDPSTVLVGHDGWADSRSGEFWKSKMVLNDFYNIQDFGVKKVREIYTPEIKEKLEKLGDQSAEYARRVLPDLLKKYKKVVFLTHVPPFREASWHEGAICKDESAPFFVNQVLGEALIEIMKTFSRKKLLVLCGHTHSKSTFRPLSNLMVITAGAEYESPLPQAPFHL